MNCVNISQTFLELLLKKKKKFRHFGSLFYFIFFPTQIEFVTGTKKGTNPSNTAASTNNNSTTTTATGKHQPQQTYYSYLLHFASPKDSYPSSM